MSKYSKYTDYLKDRKFIRWQIMPDEIIINYWSNFIEEHPECIDDINQAIAFLKNEGLNKCNLSKNEQEALLDKIKSTIELNKRVKSKKIFKFSLVAAAAIGLLVIGITLFTPYNSPISFKDDGVIIGELLNNEDVQLITNKEIIEFSDDVDVNLDESGTANIKQNNKEVKTVNINQENYNSIIVPYGKRSTITLSDGSKVWLNSGSVLEFPAKFNDKAREIRLSSGEMYIEVNHEIERPFYVHTSDFRVKVYGTAFNLSNYDNSSRSVVLVNGSVALQSLGEKEEIRLHPNELAVYNSKSDSFKKQKVDINNFISWKSGYLIFDRTPINEVLQQISRYYNLSFNFEQDLNISNRTCSGKIYLSDNLDNVMETITLLTSTKYIKENNQIYITK